MISFNVSLYKYRQKLNKTLAFLILLGMTGVLPVSGSLVFADSSDAAGFETLMDESDYPPIAVPEQPQQTQANPYGAAYGGSQPSAQQAQPRLPDPPPPPTQSSKLKFWPFGKKQAAGPPPSSNAEIILNVGPRDMPASTDPLFRLPMAVEGVSGPIEPGYYLAHQTVVDQRNRTLIIRQKGKVVLSLPLQALGAPENPGPAEPMKDKKLPPPVPVVEVKVAEDQGSLSFVWREGQKRYQSPPVRTVDEGLPQIRY